MASLGGDGASPFNQTANISAPILGLFGEEDQNPTPEDVDKISAEMTTHNKLHEFHMYPGCGHGFHCNAQVQLPTRVCSRRLGQGHSPGSTNTSKG